jgi:hypothetical protein
MASRSAIGSALICIAVVALAGGVVPARQPQLIVGESVDADFEALALQTWDAFLAVFRMRQGCFGDVWLEATYSLDSRAGYDPDTATVTVLVPGTAAMLKSGLIHEWAHHVEFQCRAHEELQAAFLVAQNLAPGAPWRPAGTTTNLTTGEWADIPSEQYAEAVVELVLGGRPIPTGAHVSPAAIRVVEEWAMAQPTRATVETKGD